MHSNHSYKAWAANSRPFLYKKEDEKKQPVPINSDHQESSENHSPLVTPESTDSTDKEAGSETRLYPDKDQ